MSHNDDTSDHDLEERPAKLQKISSDQFDRTAESPTKTADQASTEAKQPLLGPDGEPISKSQLKKLRKKAEWEAKRPQWKALQKEKRIARRERKKAAKQSQQEEEEKEESAFENVSTSNKPKNPSNTTKRPPKSNFKPKAVQLPLTILLDCSFDSYMNERELISLASQITRCYSDNGKSRFRAHLAIASFEGRLRERFETVLTGHKAWKGVKFFPAKADATNGEGEGRDFVSVANKAGEWMGEEGNVFRGAFEGLLKVEGKGEGEGDGGNGKGKTREEFQSEGEIIYLSSESEYTLTELKPYSTYIIGGLVDKNREKGLCHRRATERGIKTARLPIGEFMEMTSRKVLATNHVVEIMLRWLENRDWARAFEEVIPKRKGGVLKGSESGKGGEGEEEDEEEGDEDGDGGNGVDEMHDQDADGSTEFPAGQEAVVDQPSNSDEKDTSTAPPTSTLPS
jgi:tRNA (guanine9-N1)-methyltransferase